jgi:hypothetical protein
LNNDSLNFKILFLVGTYLVYSMIIIIVIGSFADNPVLFHDIVHGFGLELTGIELFRANMIFKFFLICSLFIPLIGLEDAKKQLGDDVLYNPIRVKWYQQRLILYLAVLIFVMTTTIMWTLRAVTSATLKEYLELSSYSFGIEVVTNTLFLFYLIVAFVTLIGLKWFDSEIMPDLDTETESEEMNNKKSAGR